jgi:hypothetical protein
MKNYKFLLPLIVALLVIAVPVSAATCSFINITQGIQGIQGINGTDGADGTDCTAAVGTVTSGSPASVTNVGTPGAAIFDFVIPPGDTGANGADGDDGAAATITIGTVTPGSPASVTNVGTPTNAIFDFVLVSGADGTTPVFGVDYFNGSDGYTPVFNVDYFNGSTGATGADGTAATIEINATFTLDAGQPATATNIGTTTAALFNFGIPQGAKGDKGDTGDTGAIPDVTQFLFLNGTRAMTGNLSIGSQYITGLHDPSISTDAATKGYVDSRPDSTYNASYLTSGDLSGYATTSYVGDVNTSMKNYVDALPDNNYNASYLTTGDLASYSTITYTGEVNTSMKNYVDARPDSTYNASYWTGTNYNASYEGNYNATYDAKPDSTYNATYDAKTNYNASYLTSGDLTGYATESYVGEQGFITSTYNSTYDSLIGISNYNATYDGKADVSYVNDVNTSMKNYVDGQGFITSTYNATYDAKPDSTYNSTYDAKPDSTFNSTYDALIGISNYNESYLTSDSLTGYATETYVNEQGFITSTYNETYDAKPDSTFNATYDAKTNYNASYLTSTDLSPYATTAYVGEVNTSMKGYVDTAISGLSNYNASYLVSDDLVGYATETYVGEQGFITSTYNATYDAKPDSTYNATYDAKPDSTYNATYDAKTNYNASYWTGTNYNASYLTSTYNSTYDSKAPSAVYGYLSLMAGSAMIGTTNPTTMTQAETSTNKNNYITVDFTDGGSEVAQWIVDFPADWNYSANVVFTPVWTATSGSGTVQFEVSGKLFPNDAALDTALGALGDSTDTLLATGDVHVSPDTAGAAISSVGTGGNTAIIKVNRDSAADSLGGTARLIALRVKYSRILA